MNVFRKLSIMNKRGLNARRRLGDILEPVSYYLGIRNFFFVGNEARDAINHLISIFGTKNVRRQMIYWCRKLNIVILIQHPIGKNNVFIHKKETYIEGSDQYMGLIPITEDDTP